MPPKSNYCCQICKNLFKLECLSFLISLPGYKKPLKLFTFCDNKECRDVRVSNILESLNQFPQEDPNHYV